jgi:hypothetical protein
MQQIALVVGVIINQQDVPSDGACGMPMDHPHVRQAYAENTQRNTCLPADSYGPHVTQGSATRKNESGAWHSFFGEMH